MGGVTNHPNRNRTARAERIVDVVLAEFGQAVIRKISMRDAMVAACAAALIDREGAAALIQRAAELIKTSANLGNTGRSLSQLEAIAEAVAAERERCAKIAQNGWLWFCPPERCATEDEVEMCKSIAAFITDWALIDREGHQTSCLSALASGDACQPDETLKRCAVCGFVVDTKFAAEKPTVRMRP